MGIEVLLRPSPSTVQNISQPCAAFSRDTLLNSRWFLEEKPKGVNGIWGDILQMTQVGQVVFMQRILFIFQVNKRSAGKAQSLRISKAEWNLECDVCSMGSYVLEEMRRYRDAENLTVFPTDTIKTLLSRFIEGFLV